MRSGIVSRLRGLPLLSIATLLLVLIIPALFADFVAPYTPFEGGLTNRFKPPAWMEGGSMAHLLGTDQVGRDVLSRIIHGARISGLVALAGVGIAALIGIAAGLVAGYFGGILDVVMMRLIDGTLAFPAIIIALAIAAAFGPSFVGVLVVIVFILWAYFARQIRGETMALMHEDFVAQARVTGQPAWRIMTLHLLPNLLPSVIVLITLQMGYVIVLESTLSFLGVGLSRPTPAWGLLVADGRGRIGSEWWISFFPGLAVALVVLSANALGDYLRGRLGVKTEL